VPQASDKLGAELKNRENIALKLTKASLALFFTVSFAIWHTPAAATVLPRPGSQAMITRKIEREILRSEQLLGRAIKKRDVVSLARLLADYYAATYEGGERGTGKTATLELCEAGSLPFYEIQDERKLEARAELVAIEGLGRNTLSLGTDRSDQTLFRVKRLWTKNKGRWLLVSQTLEPAAEESEEQE
jgi:hypothetical protein